MIDMKITKLFFDAPRVIRAVDAATRKVLSKSGAFIRQRATSSIRKRKRASKPGQPPSSHTGLLKRFIFFGYDPTAESVVIGPVGFKGSEIPNVLEHGGMTTRTRFKKGKIVRRRVRIRPRPYMGPALEAERPGLPKRWRDSVKGP